jgi:hypothetical protein
MGRQHAGSPGLLAHQKPLVAHHSL